MKITPLIVTLLAAGAFSLPLRAQSPAPVMTPVPTEGAASSPAATASPAATSEKSHFGGSITAVDAGAKTVAIHTKKQGDLSFTADDSTKITKSDGNTGTLADVKVGDHVHGAYMKSDDGKMTLLTLKDGPSKKQAGK